VTSGRPSPVGRDTAGRSTVSHGKHARCVNNDICSACFVQPEAHGVSRSHLNLERAALVRASFAKRETSRRQPQILRSFQTIHLSRLPFFTVSRRIIQFGQETLTMALTSRGRRLVLRDGSTAVKMLSKPLCGELSNKRPKLHLVKALPGAFLLTLESLNHTIAALLQGMSALSRGSGRSGRHLIPRPESWTGDRLILTDDIGHPRL
jgi:hypothetical protein